MTLEDLKQLLIAIWNDDAVKFIVANVVLNVIVALAAAIKANNFQLAKLGEFLVRKLLPYVAVYFAARLFGEAAGLPALATAVWAIITATLVGDLTDSLAQLGIQMPTALRKSAG